MSYIEESLSADEKVVAVFRQHWVTRIWMVVCILLIVTIPIAIYEWLRLRTIEHGVTNKRVVFKQGIVRVAQAQGRKAPPSLRPLRLDPAAPLAEIPAELGDSIRQVSDPELRACLESLARGLAAGDAAPAATLAIPVVGRIGERKS